MKRQILIVLFALTLSSAARANQDLILAWTSVDITTQAKGYGTVSVAARMSDDSTLKSLEVRYGEHVIAVPAKILATQKGVRLSSIRVTTCADSEGDDKYWLGVSIERYEKRSDGQIWHDTVHFPIRKDALQKPYRAWLDGSNYRTEEIGE